MKKISSAINKRLMKIYEKFSLKTVIWGSFTITAVLAAILMGISFYGRFSSQLQASIQDENQSLIEQVNNSFSSYLRNMMKVSDSIYYSIIKNTDLSKNSVSKEFQLLYDTNKDYIENIALFSIGGNLLEAAPAVIRKENIDVTKQEWFTAAIDKPENMHFSRPKVQNIFVSKDDQYKWVVSLSRVVQITQGKQVSRGVLLIDLSYDTMCELLSNVVLGNEGYVYLVDSDGNLIYHPLLQLINSGNVSENTIKDASYRDGNYEDTLNGEKRIISVKSVGYTGWKLVGVTPENGISLNNLKSNLFILFLFLFFMTALITINSYISSKVSDPIRDLEKAVNLLEDGKLNTEIQAEGFYEVKHLGNAIRDMNIQINKLMDDIVIEHESKRKNELNTLQSQINPHFLYNTLDVIVWMIENEQKEDAVTAVTALARFFRISLSKGKTIITVADELEHVRNYLKIQEMRYKNKFIYSIEAEDDVLRLATIKLVLQPLVENAIYHGMEFMDGDGEIKIRAYVSENDMVFAISDNGPGMTGETVEKIMEGIAAPAKKGSGIGVKNVNERIKLYFGMEYGIKIVSEPDNGTDIYIRLPKVPYDEIKDKEL